MTYIKNRKLSAWLGSLLFHAVLLVLFVLCWFAPVQEGSPPWDRTAIGTIIAAPVGSDTRSGAAVDSKEPAAVPSDAATERFSTVNPNTFLPIPAPGQNHQNTSTTDAGSATEIAKDFGSQNTAPGAGLGPGETVVQIFGRKGKGQKFVFVFDRSGSMEGALLRKAKEELIRSFDALDNRHQFNIIFYNHEYGMWRSGRKLVFASPEEKRNAERYIGSITAAGGTGHYQPLMTAVNLRPDVIFFLTDGESQDDLNPAQMAEIEKVNSFGKGAQINVIQFGNGGLTDSESRFLRQLAEQNYGDYVYINVSGWQ